MLKKTDAVKTIKTDLDLPPAYRTQANLWKASFFEMREAVVQANKGIRRLRRKLDSLQQTNAPNLPTSLTAENGAKAALIGEFKIPIEVLCLECGGGMAEECSLCAGSGLHISHHINVPWTTIKDIYAKAVSFFGVEGNKTKETDADRIEEVESENKKINTSG